MTLSTAHASCRALEYAELQATPPKALVKAYCDYGAVARLLYDGVSRAPLMTGAERWRADAAACNEQRDKIEVAAKARGVRLQCSKEGI